MAGFSIADFFAQLSIKADTKEVKKIEDSLKRINESLKMIGQTSVVQANKMDKAFTGDTLKTKKLQIQSAHDSLERMGASLVGFKARLSSINKQSEFVKIKNEIKEATLEAKRFKNNLKLAHNTNSILGKENIFKKPDAFQGSNDKGNDATNRFQGGDEFFERTVQGRRLLHGLNEEQVIGIKKLAAEQVKLKKSVVDSNLVLKEHAALYRKVTKAASDTGKQITSLTRAQNRLKESARQLALSMVGAFAVFEGIKSISRVGQDFEAMEASMLAVSGSSENAAKDLDYVRSESVRLGLSIKDTTKAFIKLKAGAGHKATDTDLKTIFEGLTESSTVLGLTAEETTRAIRSVVQMFGKGGVRAEELRSQLGEVLPVAMRALEKATGKTSEEITKLLELGQIGTDVLPAFGKELKSIAREGGALAKSLQTVRVQENRLFSKLQTSQETVFNSGFGEGQGDFYKSMIILLEDLQPTLRAVGGLFKELFRILASSVRMLTAPIRVIGSLIDAMMGLNDVSNHFADNTMPKLIAAGLLMLAPFGRILVKFLAIKAVIEELIGLTTKGVIGQLERDIGRDIGFDFSSDEQKKQQSGGITSDTNIFEDAFNGYKSGVKYFATGQALSDLATGVLGNSGTAITINNSQQPTIDEYGNVNIENTVERMTINGQAQR